MRRWLSLCRIRLKRPRVIAFSYCHRREPRPPLPRALPRALLVLRSELAEPELVSFLSSTAG
jgi:hypothetical protein